MYLCAIAIMFGICFFVGFFMAIIIGDDMSKPEYSGLPFLVGFIVWTIVILPATAWVLKIKNRSFCWIIFSFFWFTMPIIFLLKNKGEYLVSYVKLEKPSSL